MWMVDDNNWVKKVAGNRRSWANKMDDTCICLLFDCCSCFFFDAYTSFDDCHSLFVIFYVAEVFWWSNRHYDTHSIIQRWIFLRLTIKKSFYWYKLHFAWACAKRKRIWFILFYRLHTLSTIETSLMSVGGSSYFSLLNKTCPHKSLKFEKNSRSFSLSLINVWMWLWRMMKHLDFCTYNLHRKKVDMLQWP